MKHILQTLTLITLTFAVLAFSGCASSSNPPEAQNFADSGTGNADEDIYDGKPSTDSSSSEPLPARNESINPESADYETLAAYKVFFAFDSFSIEAGERHKVENLAKWMASNPDKNIIVAGHCDNRGTTQYNLALGERRALAIRDYLVGLGADKSKINTISYGEERPAIQGESEEAWSKNRRAEMGVLK